ncbi:hypothetical protein LY76DRAFT_587639 [Colletotrichum caudatum]|nr:hypothetical protein LY76DRAFT_587639 [Colletotrichum caudatum]
MTASDPGLRPRCPMSCYVLTLVCRIPASAAREFGHVGPANRETTASAQCISKPPTSTYAANVQGSLDRCLLR